MPLREVQLVMWESRFKDLCFSELQGLSGHHLVGVVLISSIPMKLLWEAWAPGGRLLLRTDGVLLTKDS